MPDLVRLDIEVSDTDFALVQAVVGQYVSYGWEEVPLPSGKTRLRVHAGQNASGGLEQMLLNYLPDLYIEKKIVPVEDWSEAWKEFFTPVVAGQFVVVPPWDEQARQFGPKTIVIEPKSAFGTGHHPSTVLCLRVVSMLFEQGLIRPGHRFLDLGTGTGILGIACARLGLTGLGLDIDDEAVNNALENIKLNDVQEKFEVLPGSVEMVSGQRYDLILANILANPLKEMAPEIIELLHPEACLILSGILLNQVPDVEAAYACLGAGRCICAPGMLSGAEDHGIVNPDEHWACLSWSGKSVPM